MAAICGKKNKKIIQNKGWVIDYRGNTDYYRDIFWKNVVDSNYDNKYYKIYKLI